MALRKIPEDHIPNIQQYYAQGLSITDIATIYGVTYASMYRFMKRRSFVIRTQSQASLISTKTLVGLNKWRQKHGSWCKGLTKDDPRLRELIEKGRITQIKNGKSKGIKNPMYGKAPRYKVGYRKDLKHFVRSSWEAGFARLLKHLKIVYEYEKHTFELSNGKTYTPDFYLPSKNKFYEIKGYAFTDKHKKFTEEYREKLILVDERFYHRLLQRFGNRVAMIEGDEVFYTTEEIESAFMQWLQDKDKISVRKFCKSLNISPKNIQKTYGSESAFVEKHQSDIITSQKKILKEKYKKFACECRPTGKAFYKFYPRSRCLIRNIFGSWKNFLASLE